MSDRYFYSTAAKWSFVGFTILVLSTWIASAGFEHVDMALFGYYIAAVISMIGMVVRLTLFFARPATSQVLKRSLKQMKAEKNAPAKLSPPRPSITSSYRNSSGNEVGTVGPNIC